jgi:hypothetical protein
MKLKKSSGQALIEYILLICLIAIPVYCMFKLFSQWMKIIYIEQVRELGYEVPLEGQIIPLKKQAIKIQMEAIALRNEIETYYR